MISNLYWYKATLRRIYDADTIYVDIDVGFGVTIRGGNGKGEPLRLARIDAPEIRGEERPQGLEAKAWLETKIKPGDEVFLHTIKWQGKYGRYIADVYTTGDEVSLNDEMVKVGHAIYVDY